MLRVHQLNVAFVTREGRHHAVRDVSFELEQGQTLGIVGESGSGKSVTCYSMLGLLPSPPAQIESGEAWFEGRNLLTLPNHELRRIRGARIAMIFQDPMTSLNPNMRIGAQLAEAIRQHEKLSGEALKERIIKALTEVGIRSPEDRLNSFPHEFSGGMRQRVMIAMALALEPDVLIADEPTTALDVTIQAQILDLLKEIQQRRRLSIIFISHDLAVVRRVAQQVLVMKEGEIVERGEPEALFNRPQHPYTQKLINAIPNSAKIAEDADAERPVIMRVHNLCTRFHSRSGFLWASKTRTVTAVNNISLDIGKGEILGLVGESGSGKSTFGRSVMRLVDAESGTVEFEGQNIYALPRSGLKPIRRRIQMIFQDPYASLNPRMTVFETLSEPLLLHGLASSTADLSTKVNRLMDDVGLARSAIRKYPHEFSGGQRQRIAIARAIASEPQLIVADEPVSALDVTIQAQILDLLLQLTRERSLSMLFISHDLGVVRYLCDRVAVMKAGEIVELGSAKTVFEQPRHDYTQKLLAAIPA